MSAFKRMNEQYPLYGKHAGLDPKEWWIRIIRECVLQAGANEGQIDSVMHKLGPRLLERFESGEGYRNFPETLTCCACSLRPRSRRLIPVDELRELGVKTTIVSNADPRICASPAMNAADDSEHDTISRDPGQAVVPAHAIMGCRAGQA